MILWRRLDGPGHDACRLVAAQRGWRLEGTAVFRDAGDVACLNYWVSCDSSWRTEEAEVIGWLGSTRLHLRVNARGLGDWTLNGRTVAEPAGCVDLDLGFTPATNPLQLGGSLCPWVKPPRFPSLGWTCAPALWNGWSNVTSVAEKRAIGTAHRCSSTRPSSRSTLQVWCSHIQACGKRNSDRAFQCHFARFRSRHDRSHKRRRTALATSCPL
jgi:hypothetical protein